MTDSELVRRLSALPSLQGIPRKELEWLADHGQFRMYEPGLFMAPNAKLEDLFIVLSGRVAVVVDRGVGPRRVFEWTAGDVTGLLPFSRASEVGSDVRAEIRTETLAIPGRLFPEMTSVCPEFTALAVHVMVDRARRFKSSDLQDEKMMSLGKLAAGLAHELNNPASAAMRGAKTLGAGLAAAERASRALCRAGLSEGQIAAVEALTAGWWEPSSASLGHDGEGAIGAWLGRHGLDERQAESLVECSIPTDGLDRLLEIVPPDALDAAIGWVVAESEVRLMAHDVETAVVRIYDLVGAVKRFTHMDKAAGVGAVDVVAGLRDTFAMVTPRIEAKGVRLTLEADPELPSARAVPSELNQVWINLIDNAIDAVGESGCIEVHLGQELDRIVVRVIDDGPGIAPEILSRVFDPFFTTKPPGQGLGLGLTTARELLRGSGGEITVRSAPGRTEFRVSLALGPTSPSASSAGRLAGLGA